MKGFSNTAWATISIICILLVIVLSYLWARLNSNLFAVAVLAAGAVFVIALNRSSK